MRYALLLVLGLALVGVAPVTAQAQRPDRPAKRQHPHAMHHERHRALAHDRLEDRRDLLEDRRDRLEDRRDRWEDRVDRHDHGGRRDRLEDRRDRREDRRDRREDRRDRRGGSS